MDSITDVRDLGPETDVLTETSRGLLAHALLEDDPLQTYLDDVETPRYVLRNKQGLTVERPDGTETVTPNGRYCGLALASDARVLFVVGGRDGDRSRSVSLVDVVDVRSEDGMLGGALVFETVDDARYRFPCRGDTGPAESYLDTAVGTWTRAGLEGHTPPAGRPTGTTSSSSSPIVSAGETLV